MRGGPDNRLPIILLSGYLGAGKTTWLRHALFAKTYGAAQVFVQEAAEQPIDDLLLQRARDVRVLTGKAGTAAGRDEMVASLLDIAEARTNAGQGGGPDTLIIETSGLADPTEIIVAIREHPVLVYHFALQETIIMSDAIHLRAALQSDALCRAQLLCADRILMSKAEDIPAQQLSNLLATIATINPAAPVALSSFGVERDIPDLPEPSEILQCAGGDARIQAHAVSLTMPKNVDWIEFTVWLSALLHAHHETILRVKGVIGTDEGLLLLQSVRKTMQQPEILPPDQSGVKTGEIVFIGANLSRAVLHSSLLGFLAKTPAPI